MFKDKMCKTTVAVIYVIVYHIRQVKLRSNIYL